MAGNELVRVDRHADGVVVLTLNDPDKCNPMSEAMTVQWRAVMHELQNDLELRAVVVTGAGRAFCAGADLAELDELRTAGLLESRRRLTRLYRDWLSVRQLAVPTIAAINGHAIGGGLALALACEMRYCAMEARLGSPFVKLGLHSGMATMAELVAAVGTQRASELLYTGRLVDGTEAAKIGLVLAAAPAEYVLDQALSTAHAIAEAAPAAVGLTRSGLLNGPFTVEASLAWESVAQPLTAMTEDFAEGIAAARQHHVPVFSGR